MRFGNWIVTNNGISWNGEGLNRFDILKNGLNDIRYSLSGDFYEWIMVATDEEWLTQNDLYDLNYAFVFAIAKFNLDFSYEVFDATLAEQYEMFDAEEDEDNEDD